MKPYFTKYLLVEGEIKEGDYVLGGPGDEAEGEIWQWDGDSHISEDDDKKVKLFLCSRDVKLGDKVKFKDISVEVDIPIDEHNWSWLSKHAPWSVIGEISPEATWIKEGDVFDEGEIKKMVDLGFGAIAEWIEGRESLGYKPVMQIKCPICKKFH